MKVLESSEIRDLNQQEMQAEILAIKKILFDFRLKQATRQTIKPHSLRAYKHPHSLRAYKHQLARITTIQHEKYNINQ